VYHSSARDGVTRIPAIDRGRVIDEEGFVREGESGRIEDGSSHILFPVAVGAIFLVMLVAGALLG
jgi:hypothetical protein